MGRYAPDPAMLAARPTFGLAVDFANLIFVVLGVARIET